MAIILTETAAGEIKRYREAQKVEEAACCGWAWPAAAAPGCNIRWDSRPISIPQIDANYEQHGVAIVTTKKMALHLDGTTIDFLDGPMGRGFSIENPNVPRGGGCPGCGHH